MLRYYYRTSCGLDIRILCLVQNEHGSCDWPSCKDILAPAGKVVSGQITMNKVIAKSLTEENAFLPSSFPLPRCRCLRYIGRP